MPWHTPSTIRCSGVQPVAYLALVALACMALASCGGGPGAPHPDLVVEDPAVGNDRSDAEPGFTFSATVRNAGRGNAAATMLLVYRSDDETITTSDQEVDTVTVAELTASESMVTSVMVPSSPGTHYYGACVEPVAAESDTANNCSAAVRVTVPAQDTKPQPDLVVESPRVSGDGPAAGASFTFSATVGNDGDGTAAATTLRAYLSDDETITTDDQQVATAAVPELAASKHSPASEELSAPASAGTYYYGACVDPVAGESDTTNNCSEAVQVTVQAPQVPVSGPPGPDLVVKRIWVKPRDPPIGGIFFLLADVRNRGAGTSPYTKLRFYRSTDATITRSDTELGTEWVTQLRIDSDVYHGYEYVAVLAPSSKATHYYGACVDAVAGESATTNNCSAVKLEVSRYSPDLIVSSWSALRTRAGASSSVIVAVWNEGSPSEATTLRLLLLPDRKSAPSAGTEVGNVGVPAMVLTHNWPTFLKRTVEYQTPATAGRYYYVLCVDVARGETNTANNCSLVVAIDFY